VTVKKMPVRRWLQGLNRAMPVVLDAAGIMLLSGSASVFGFMAGLIVGTAVTLAAAGAGFLVLSWRFYSGT